MFKNICLYLVLAGLIVCLLAPAYGQVTLSMPDTTASPGDIIQLPIYTSNLSGLGVGQFDLDVVWDDSTLITCSQYSIIGTILEGHPMFFINCTYGPGYILCRTTNIGPQALSGAGILIKFYFNVSQTATGSNR